MKTLGQKAKKNKVIKENIIVSKSVEKETIVFVLDILPNGRSDDSRPKEQKKSLVLGIGEKNFVLMELLPKETKVINVQDNVYVGDGDRPVIDHINRRIVYSELTHCAQLELPSTIMKIVIDNETRFLSLFFSEVRRNTTRSQWLGLSPGICWKIIEESKKKKFASFNDLVERVKGLHEPQILIVNWVLDELRKERRNRNTEKRKGKRNVKRKESTQGLNGSTISESVKLVHMEKIPNQVAKRT
ncbi:MAG: DUF655 domain-containing protein [Candidatus Methanoperedens sp.]